MKGSASQKLALAELLWKRTMVSQEWTAKNLAMRSALNVRRQLRWFDRAKANTKLPPERRGFLKVAWEGEAEGCFVKICTLTPSSPQAVRESAAGAEGASVYALGDAGRGAGGLSGTADLTDACAGPKTLVRSKPQPSKRTKGPRSSTRDPTRAVLPGRKRHTFPNPSTSADPFPPHARSSARAAAPVGTRRNASPAGHQAAV